MRHEIMELCGSGLMAGSHRAVAAAWESSEVEGALAWSCLFPKPPLQVGKAELGCVGWGSSETPLGQWLACLALLTENLHIYSFIISSFIHSFVCPALAGNQPWSSKAKGQPLPQVPPEFSQGRGSQSLQPAWSHTEDHQPGPLWNLLSPPLGWHWGKAESPRTWSNLFCRVNIRSPQGVPMRWSHQSINLPKVTISNPETSLKIIAMIFLTVYLSLSI